MSWFGDLGQFELFNLKGMADQVKDNPFRLLYGAADPFSTKVWNKILGRDDKPLIDQWGGAAEHRYEDAENAGIDTGAGRTGHNIAKAVASFYAGGYGADKAGGLLGGTQAAGGTGGAGYGLGQPVVSGNVGNASYAGGSQPGLLGGFGESLNSFNQTAKPYMDALSTGQQAAGLLTPRQEPLAGAQPQQQVGSGPQALAQIAQGNGNDIIQRRREYAANRRAARGY